MQPSSSSQPPPPQFIVFWILWFALTSGNVMLQFLIGHGLPQGVDQGQAPLAFVGIAIGTATLSFAMRMLVLPRIEGLVKKLPMMIVGLALAEATHFLGMFLIGDKFPQTQLALFVTSVLCTLVHAPIYAKPAGQEESSFGYRK